MRTDVIIIGAGASGLMCASEAGKRGRSVLVLEHSDRMCSKIRVSGGGKCNFTNRNVARENYVSHNPHFVTSALSRFTPEDFLSLMARHRIKYHERDAGQLFCDESSREIIDMLKAECDRGSVKFLLNCSISKIVKEMRFVVSTNRGTFQSDSLVVATGGLSMPNLGATNCGYQIAKQFGMKITALKPALVPLRFTREDAERFASLSGISMDVTVSCEKVKFRDKVLFTHKGLSGPGILQISSYWDGKEIITLDLLPDVDIRGVLMEHRRSRMLLTTLLHRYLPGRFARIWCDLTFTSRPLNQYSSKDLDMIALSLHDWRVRPAGPEGFHKAEVTLGGVDTSELSSKTMESKKVPGLYFIGEVVDVTGQLGGYNLHWAWASGHAAGQVV